MQIARGETVLVRIRHGWSDYKPLVIRVAVVVLAIVALADLTHKFHRAVWSPIGSEDLTGRYEELRNWFAGKAPAPEPGRVYYPPASYVMLWPFLGWLSLPAAKLLWALTVLAMLLWLSALVVRESGAETPMERALVALMPLSMNAAGFTLANGQLSAHVLALLLGSLLMLQEPDLTAQDDLRLAVLFLAALVKPTFSAPFFWLVLFVRNNLRPALLIALGYLLLTVFALAFQPLSKETLFGWLGSGVQFGAIYGYGHLPGLLGAYGLEAWILPLSLTLLLALGAWVYQHRHADLWLLLGVTALVARFWTYHVSYDDLLILLPMLTLFRLAKQSPTPAISAGAGLLLAVTLVIMLVPHRLHMLAQNAQLSPFFNWLFTWGYASVWLLVLIFLLRVAGRDQRQESHNQKQR